MSIFLKLLGPMRFNFLILTPACVAVGVASASYEAQEVSLLYVSLILFGAVMSHVSVNAFNEYFDFRSGLDLAITQRTPFSGGTGTLPATPEAAPGTLIVAIVSLLLTASVGVFFFFVWGVGILPLGILGLLLIFFYTNFVVYNPLVCLLAPGLGFGPLMVMGTHFCLTGNYSLVSFLASLVPFFFVSNLLLLNQFPDAETDKKFGRKHFPILIGNRSSSIIYAVFNIGAYLSVAVSVYYGYLPPWSLLSLVTIAVAIPATIGAYRHANDTPRLMPYMGYNVVINIVTPLLLALGIFLA